MALTQPTEASTSSSDAVLARLSVVVPAAALNGNGKVSPPTPPGPATPTGADATAASDLRGEFGGTGLLIADLRTAYILANAARHRVIERLFAVTPDQQTLVTVIVVLMLADAVHDQATRLVGMRRAPSLGEGLLGAASTREVLCSLAGVSSRETPALGTLLAIAVVGGTTAPVLVKSIHAARASSHRLVSGFHHRYGYVVDPGHWRSRRAQRRYAQDGQSSGGLPNLQG